MRGKDERKLDDLKKLIRRLDGTDDPSATTGKSAKRAGYVGSLRQHGAAPHPQAPRDDASNPMSAQDWRGAASDGGRPRERSPSSKAVIIGAATAAIVSTVIAIVITSGIAGMRGPPGGADTASLLPSFSDGAKRMFGLGEANPTPAELMIKEAVNLINDGNLVAARILLERATGLGSGVAALALGETYDPVRAAQMRTGGNEIDARKARVWYERALALGSGDALGRLAALDGKQ